jgi:ferredoxin
MTVVITEACIKCKYMDCILMCPVDCFHEGENMLVVDPENCIDCGVCEPECSAKAILQDTEPGAKKWVEFNARYAAFWPNITEMERYPLPDADDWKDVPDKLENHFSPKPAIRE